jgi:hypothetical protein
MAGFIRRTGRPRAEGLPRSNALEPQGLSRPNSFGTPDVEDPIHGQVLYDPLQISTGLPQRDPLVEQIGIPPRRRPPARCVPWTPVVGGQGHPQVPPKAIPLLGQILGAKGDAHPWAVQPGHPIRQA